MLRIKEDKWEEFCEKAEELGFSEISDAYFIDYGAFEDLSIEFDTKTKESDRKLIYMGNDEFLKIVFELFSQGYVEKV